MRITGKLELELRESLEMGVEDKKWKKGISTYKEDFLYAVFTVRLLLIRCQDTTSVD
jgi:hypothetical protein